MLELTHDSNWPYRETEDGKGVPTQAVVLGLGSMFNHSTRDQNVVWKRDLKAQTVTYRALQNIKAGEELCISYGKLWFVDSDMEEEVVEGDGSDLLNRIDVDLQEATRASLKCCSLGIIVLECTVTAVPTSKDFPGSIALYSLYSHLDSSILGLYVHVPQ